MKEDKINILISKYLREDCSPEEKKMVEQWRSKGQSNQRHFEEIQKIEQQLAKMDFLTDTNTDQEWTKLQSKLVLSAKSSAEGKIRTLKSSYRKYFALAAALAALVVIVWLTIPKAYKSPVMAQEFRTERGATMDYQLPDGTKVKLNADSYLVLEDDFSGEERRVRLQGEGFFEVASNPNKPFIVETEDVFTQVLGTAFNLRAYPESPQIDVAVTEGKVAFKSKVQEGLLLEANYAASYNKSNKTFQKEQFQPGMATAWLNGGLHFKDEQLHSIFLELERKFDIQIDNQTNLGDESYSVELEQIDDPSALLDLIAITFNLTYTQNGKVITIQQK